MSASNSMAATFELGFKKAMVGTVQTVSLFLCTIGFRKQSSHLVGPPFLAMKVFHYLDKWLFAKNTDY